MYRLLLPVAVMAGLMWPVPVHAKRPYIEGNLRPVAEGPLHIRGVPCGRYLISTPSTGPGTREGVGLLISSELAENLWVLTAASRVTVILEEARQVPWVSVELETGYFHARLHISSAQLREASCLKEVTRG